MKTARLELRPWNEADLASFAEISASSEVMRYYPEPLTSQQSRELADKIQNKIKENGWGFWAVELLATKQFIGFVGLNEPDYQLPVKPCLEVGWRLGSEYWGKGYATEAAKKALEYAFTELKTDKVYSFASKINTKSIAVMQRIGMKDIKQNFNHPLIPAPSPLSEHVLYRITYQQWLEQSNEK